MDADHAKPRSDLELRDLPRWMLVVLTTFFAALTVAVWLIGPHLWPVLGWLLACVAVLGLVGCLIEVVARWLRRAS